MIQIKALNKVYGTGKVQFQALKNVDITIKEGEFVIKVKKLNCYVTSMDHGRF